MVPAAAFADAVPMGRVLQSRGPFAVTRPARLSRGLGQALIRGVSVVTIAGLPSEDRTGDDQGAGC